MVLVKAVPVVLFAVILLTGCSFNQTMFESERSVDREHLAKEYGDANPASSIVIHSKDRSYEFQVRVSKLHNRLLVQSAQETAEATKGSVEIGTLGLIKQRLDEAPYRQAAMTYLTNQKFFGCKLEFGAELLHKAFEWTYSCAQK